MATLSAGQPVKVQNLDGPQEPGILHYNQKA
jgi:hypothetical protein